MAINLESHGLPAAAAYHAPVTVQDHGQGQGQGQQQSAAEAGFTNASAFEARPGASVAAPAAQQEASGGGDLLSKLSGFIRAVGDVVVQLGEFLRSAGGAPSADEGPQPQANPAQVPTAPAGAPAQAAPGGAQPLLGAPGQPATATAMPAIQQQAALGGADARGSTSTMQARPAPAQRSVSNPALASLSMAAASLGASVGALRGGGARSSSSGGFPELNPLPPFHREEAMFMGFPGYEPGIPETPSFPSFDPGTPPAFSGGEEPNPGELNRGLSATARPPVQPGYAEQLAVAQGPGSLEAANEIVQVQAAEEAGLPDNVVPFRRPASQEPALGFQGDGAAAQPGDSSADPRFSGIVFRPAFYAMLRC